jgi:hypothetical protein
VEDSIPAILRRLENLFISRPAGPFLPQSKTRRHPGLSLVSGDYLVHIRRFEPTTEGSSWSGHSDSDRAIVRAIGQLQASRGGISVAGRGDREYAVGHSNSGVQQSTDTRIWLYQSLSQLHCQECSEFLDNLSTASCSGPNLGGSMRH